MSEPDAVNKNREARLERMLRDRRAEIVSVLERQLGQGVGEDVLNAIDESIEIGDRSVQILGQDVALGVLQLKREELRQIDRALATVRDGAYGLCQECEAEIGEERLRIMPFATLCVDCKRRQEVEDRRIEITGRGFRAGFRDIREGSDDED